MADQILTKPKLVERLKKLTNAQLEQMTDDERRAILKEMRSIGLVSLSTQVIDRLDTDEMDMLIADARRDVQLEVKRS